MPPYEHLCMSACQHIINSAFKGSTGCRIYSLVWSGHVLGCLISMKASCPVIMSAFQHFIIPSFHHTSMLAFPCSSMIRPFLMQHYKVTVLQRSSIPVFQNINVAPCQHTKISAYRHVRTSAFQHSSIIPLYHIIDKATIGTIILANRYKQQKNLYTMAWGHGCYNINTQNSTEQHACYIHHSCQPNCSI